MTCSCPKCQAKIEIDLSNVPEKGTFSPCPQCKGRFWINRESYARMSLRKEGNLYCDHCGKELIKKIVCDSCGVMYPDYYLIQSSRPPRRQVEKADLFSFSLSKKPAIQTSKYAYYSRKEKESHVALQGSFLKAISIAAIVILLAVGVNFYFQKKKTEELYAKNYMRTLYIIKSGTDLSLKICSNITNNWKTTGQNSSAGIGADDINKLSNVKGMADRSMQKLNDPPKKFITSKEKLIKLYNVYSNMNELAIGPSGTLASFTDSTSKSQRDFNTIAQDLTSTFPPALNKEFQNSKTKYKLLSEI